MVGRCYKIDEAVNGWKTTVPEFEYLYVHYHCIESVDICFVDESCSWQNAFNT